MFIIFLKINIKIYYVKMTILEVLKNTINVIRSKLDDNKNTIKLLYQLNNETIDSSVILPMENSMPGNVLEAVIADILITYYKDPDGGYWSHQKNGKSIDLIYHSNNLKKNKKCADKVSEILLEVKSAVKNFNAEPSNEYTKFKSKFKHAFILYILYEIDDLKSILQLNKYNIKIYNYSKMVRKNKISNNKVKALVENNRRLYESIMRDVAKTVKRHLNESNMDNKKLSYNLNCFKKFILKTINNRKFIKTYLDDNELTKDNLMEEYESIDWVSIESVINDFLNYLYNEFDFDNSNFNGSEMEILLTAMCSNEYGETPRYEWLDDDYPDLSRYFTYSAALMDIEIEVKDIIKNFEECIPNFVFYSIEEKIAYAKIPESIK